MRQSDFHFQNLAYRPVGYNLNAGGVDARRTTVA